MRVLIAIISYLAGSFPTGYLLVRGAGLKDVRQFGSRSTGATNVLRVKGPKTALLVALVDVIKGFLPALLALRTTGDPGFAGLCAFLAVLGHCFPFSIGFRGGKGVATSLGAYVAFAGLPWILGVGVFGLVAGLTRRVSLGSILGSLAVPAGVLALGGSKGIFAWSLAIAALVVFQHRGNIGRLLKGTERKLGEKTS
jgi:acyl phosphate:glycerol-3-phosphate acyltransferase